MKYRVYVVIPIPAVYTLEPEGETDKILNSAHENGFSFKAITPTDIAHAGHHFYSQAQRVGGVAQSVIKNNRQCFLLETVWFTCLIAPSHRRNSRIVGREPA